MAFVTDTFTDTDAVLLENHTPEAGGALTLSGTAGKIATNRARAGTANLNAAYYYAAAPASADYSVTGVVRVVSDIGGQYVGVMGRVTVDGGGQDDYEAITNSDGDVVSLYVRVDGAPSFLASYAVAFAVSTSYEIKLEITDAAKKVYIDGVERISSADNSITAAGKAGVTMYGSSISDASGHHIDSVIAEDPAAAAAPRRLALLGVGV